MSGKAAADRALRDLVERLQAELARATAVARRLETRLAESEQERRRLVGELAQARERFQDAEQSFRHLLDRLARSHRERQELIAELKRTYRRPRPSGRAAKRPGDPTLVNALFEWLGAL